MKTLSYLLQVAIKLLRLLDLSAERIYNNLIKPFGRTYGLFHHRH